LLLGIVFIILCNVVDPDRPTAHINTILSSAIKIYV